MSNEAQPAYQKSKSITIIIGAPPFSRIDGKEGIDLALVCAAFDRPITLIFAGKGVFHLIKQQAGDFFSDKLHDKQLGALEFYDIEQINIEKESMEKYALKQNCLIAGVTIISQEKVKQLCANSQQTIIF